MPERDKPYNAGMYIIAIGWLWVTLMMAITEPNIVASALTFTFYGVLPCSLLMWLMGTPARRRRKAAREAAEMAGSGEPATLAERSAVTGDQLAHTPDRGDAERNQ